MALRKNFKTEESKTTVVNINSGVEYDVYIGRANRRYKLPGSIWGNPYKPWQDGDSDAVLKKYREYVLNSPDLMARLSELKGKRLGCWCAPESCHGDVLIELMEKHKGK